MHSNYKIPGTYYADPLKDYEDESLYPLFQEKLDEFKFILQKEIHSNQPKTYYKFGDGDYYFLKKEKFGSAKPGIRALRKPYWMINHKKFINESKQNDYYLCEIFKSNSSKFFETFSQNYDFPAEFVYGLVANKWFFKEFKGKIGLIGGKEKINIIKSLMEYEEYQEYLGLEKFSDYLTIPQKFACDNLDKTFKDLRNQVIKSNSKIFLIGIGHVKSGLLSQLKDVKDAIYLDVGSGIDALAGIVDIYRPYFGDWTNFKLTETNVYKNVDYLRYEGLGKSKFLD